MDDIPGWAWAVCGLAVGAFARGITAVLKTDERYIQRRECNLLHVASNANLAEIRARTEANVIAIQAVDDRRVALTDEIQRSVMPKLMALEQGLDHNKEALRELRENQKETNSLIKTLIERPG